MSNFTRTLTYLTLGTTLTTWVACASFDREQPSTAPAGSSTETTADPASESDEQLQGETRSDPRAATTDVPAAGEESDDSARLLPPQSEVSKSPAPVTATPVAPAAQPPAEPKPADDGLAEGKAGKKGDAARAPAKTPIVGDTTVLGGASGRAGGGHAAGPGLREPEGARPELQARLSREKDKRGGDGDESSGTGTFEARESRINAFTQAATDRLSTFAIDVDTAAYSIARRTLDSDRLPTSSLVRVEEFINYFKYDYERPAGDRNLFSIQADGSQSPVDRSKHLLRVGIQGRAVEDSERLPANLVFLVDTSCSMTSQDKLSLAKTALKTAVDHLGANDRVAITTYAGGVSLVLAPTSGAEKKKIKRAIDGLEPNGGTAMQSGMELAYKQAAQMLRPNSITRIIICSDGDANIGSTSPDDILRRIEGYVKEGVTLSTIGFGDGNYKDAMMEKLANKGNGNYYYVDSRRQAERVFGRDLTKMIQDIAQDVKIQVDFDPSVVSAYRLVGYENRDVADRDFRNDQVDAGEIGAGHQVTAIYELDLVEGARGTLATVRVRAKQPGGTSAKEVALEVPASVVDRAFAHAPEDYRFATAVMGGAELLRKSPFASGWTFANVIAIVSETDPFDDPDRAEFLSLMKKAAYLSGEARPVGMR
ncbi:MAG: von Willebrand factor type A domain-containing protein [Deltaproteobacteria bacterium]|nr:von Willebrand factor type A domain-containing protein [Deltaproteobacteria bacterium]